MKKILLVCLAFFFALCVIVISCTKTVNIPLAYTVTDTNSNALKDIYIPDSGTFVYPVWVKFLTGYNGDSVKLTFSGLPADVRVTPDSFSALPSYVENFVFYTNRATHGKYPITITSYSKTTGYKYYNLNLGVIPAYCPGAFIGNLSGSNACAPSGYYHYTATAVRSTYANTMYVNNFGGYGTNVNVEMVLDCENDSAYVAQNNYGNNLIMKGQGIFTGNQIIIWYNASSTPLGGGAVNCVDTLTVAP